MTKLNWWKENGNIKLPELKKNNNNKKLTEKEIRNIIDDKNLNIFEKILKTYWYYLDNKEFWLLKKIFDDILKNGKNKNYTTWNDYYSGLYISSQILLWNFNKIQNEIKNRIEWIYKNKEYLEELIEIAYGDFLGREECRYSYEDWWFEDYDEFNMYIESHPRKKSQILKRIKEDVINNKIPEINYYIRNWNIYKNLLNWKVNFNEIIKYLFFSWYIITDVDDTYWYNNWDILCWFEIVTHELCQYYFKGLQIYEILSNYWIKLDIEGQNDWKLYILNKYIEKMNISTFTENNDFLFWIQFDFNLRHE